MESPATRTDAGPSDLTNLTSRAQIEAYLASLTLQESALDSTLTSLISSRAQITAQLKTLEGLRGVVGEVQEQAEHMVREVSAIAETAERVGGKVRVLDEEQSKVRESIEVVQAVQELKSSIAALDAAMQKEDWEAATRFMQRATAIDPSVTMSGFAEAVVPTSNLPLSPPQTLSTLRASLLETFLASFRAASTSGDTNNINRFFKLFPMIGEEDMGLEVYAEWVGGIVRTKTAAFSSKSQSPSHFSNLLTSLFESIALIISQHQPVVEKYYGLGKMLTVAQKLLNESDRLGLRIVLNWAEERRVNKKLVLAADYSFPLLTSGRRRGKGEEAATQEDGTDPREIDALLAEISMMSGRWELLRRFLYGRLKDTDEPDSPTLEEGEGDEVALEDEAPIPSSSADLAMVEESALGKAIAKQLNKVYIPLELWYLRSSVEKAHQMDEVDLLSNPSLSSSLDDTFYILKKTLYRLVSMASIDTLVVMCKEVRRIMEKDVADIWRGVMDGAFKEVASGGGVGRTREDERERREYDARVAFVAYLNNLDTAAEYTVRLIDEVLAGDVLHQAFFLDAEMERAKIAVLGVRGVEDKFRSTLKSGLDHLFNQLLRPRLRPILSEVYRDISYILDEDSYADAEYRDDVRKRFIKSWEALLSGYRTSLTPNNFDLFFSTAINVLVRPWEGIIRGMRFTELGALRLDRDLRSILSYLCSQSAFASGSIRESFSRLQQIATLLTLDSPEEAEEVLSATGNRLTQGEIKTIWAMRM